MQNVLFLKNKLKRQIDLNGQSFSAYRSVYDERHQKTDEEEEVATFTGIFHESTSYVKNTVGEAGVIRSKPQPMILTLITEESKKLAVDDRIAISDCTYVIVSKKNVKQLDVAYDISLEVKV